MKYQDDQNVLEEVKNHGQKDPYLWQLGLTYFTQRCATLSSSNAASSASYEKCLEYLKQYLSVLHEQSTLSPLEVMETLSASPDLPYGLVKAYLRKAFATSAEEIEEERQAITKFQADCDEMHEENRALQQKAMVFQNKKCDLCTHELDLPTVHFFCQHSFHQVGQKALMLVEMLCYPWR